MQTQMQVTQALEQYMMLDLANATLEQCWDVCYNNNVTRDDLIGGEVQDITQQKMSACGRKCIARSFEVMKLMMESREQAQKEQMQGLPPGSLSA